MIKPYIRDGTFLGSTFETGSAYFFFGSNKLDRAALTAQFPLARLCYLKQVHGNKVVPGNSTDIAEADGHFTAKAGFGLVIQTADCLPVMLANNSQVCALHAGWRGAAADIVGAAKTFFLEPPEVAVIGPHIRAANFEIGNDVMKTLLTSVPNQPDASQFVRPHKDPEKCYFNLAALVRLQLLCHYPEIQLYDGGEDTFSNLAYYSYRRDRGGGGRQYSFVMLKP